MTLDRNCCLLKAVLCPYPYPRSKSIFRGLSFYVINLRIFWTELKMIVVIVDEVLFDEVSCTRVLGKEINNLHIATFQISLCICIVGLNLPNQSSREEEVLRMIQR